MSKFQKYRNKTEAEIGLEKGNNSDMLKNGIFINLRDFSIIRRLLNSSIDSVSIPHLLGDEEVLSECVKSR